MPSNLRYSEALNHLYQVCECLDWDPELTRNLILLEVELSFLSCTQSEQKSIIVDTQDE